MSSRAAALWGGADYERVAQRFAGVHDGLVARLDIQPEERVLDVATGTGEVALRAARAGAHVTGLDIAPKLLEQARAKAEAEGLDVTWQEGDAQALPYDDGAFDVVTSCFGVIFPPDREATARELGRVAAPRARLGLTTWRPHVVMTDIYKRFVDEPLPVDPEAWGDEANVRALLGEAWELDFDEGVWVFEEESPESAWEWSVSSIPPLAALHRSLDPDRQAELRQAHLEHFGRYVDGRRVAEPREYLLILGRRR